jgi:succinyl-diaminopimelate desuccinylase
MSDNSFPADPLGLLKDLIHCPSVTPHEAGALDIVQAFLEPLGFDCTRMVFEGEGSYPVDNLFATRGTSGRHLLFGGHTDVVPPGDEALWTHAPFSADEAEGMIWGRGAVDMKSGVAAFCAAAARAVENGHADKGIISLAITNDEEADAINGTDRLLKWAAGQGHKFDFSIVGEPSSASILGDSIKIGRRGSISGIIHVAGKQGHSAYPERAKNPVPVLAALAWALTTAPLDEGTEHFQASNLEVTSIDVGNMATNVIPAGGQLSFNIRFNDRWNPQSIRAWIDERVASVDHGGTIVNWREVGAIAKSFVSPASADVEKICDAVNAITGRQPERATFGGTSDARFIASYCPVVECGLVGTTMHQVDERVDIGQLEDLTKIYAQFMRNFF